MPKFVNRSRSGWPRPKWLRPPLVPLVYLFFIALPLSVWASPGADLKATAFLVVSFALLLLVSAAPGSRAYSSTSWPNPSVPGSRPRRLGREPGSATKASAVWVLAYFALGAGIAFFHARFHANELAGIMLLFLPLAAALVFDRALSGVRRFQAFLLTLLFGGTLLATGSRGGIVALAAAGAVMLLLERRWLLLLLGLPVVAVLLMLGPIDWLVYDGKAQGLTIDSLLTGRPEIWRRSLHAIADFTWTGIGAGTFPDVVPALYYPPGARKLDDAHSLVLQTALDLGIGGLLAMAAIVALALRHARSSWRRAPTTEHVVTLAPLRDVVALAPLRDVVALAPLRDVVALAPLRGDGRAWAAGLFGSLLAFLIFNLFDAVALGTPGGLAFCVLLGLAYALPRPRQQRRRWRIPARGQRRILLGLILMALGLSSARDARHRGRAAVLGARAVVHEPDLLPVAHAALGAVRRSTCRAGWLEGKVAAALGRPRLRDAAWAAALRCAATFVPLIADELPDHRQLAEQALEAQPSSAQAHVWLARIRARSGDRDAAQDLYLRGLDLDPGHGVAWIELGRLRLPTDAQAALAAFVEGCRHGDPGANGCRAAGATAEQLGDVEAAIRYYRKSRLAWARERADQLENQYDPHD